MKYIYYIILLPLLFVIHLVAHSQKSDFANQRTNLVISTDNPSGTNKDIDNIEDVIFSTVDKSDKLVTPKNLSDFYLQMNQEQFVIPISLDFKGYIDEIIILNNNSEIVFEREMNNSKTTSFNIPIDLLKSGTYFVRAKTSAGIDIKRVVISD